MSRTFRELFGSNTGKLTDKWDLYLTEWDRLLSPLKKKPVRILEIGVQNGGSLELWAKYYRKAEKIVGCDIDQNCALLKFSDPRIEVVIGDANTTACEGSILGRSNSFDIIIDDGAHTSSEVIRAFSRYFPHLSVGGIYIIEDMHCSYWSDYEGGIYYPLSSIAFLKRLVDICNHEHWKKPLTRVAYLSEFSKAYQIQFTERELSRIHSVEFINSLGCITKKAVGDNLLGARRVTGTKETVTRGFDQNDHIAIGKLSKGKQDDNSLDVFEITKRLIGKSKQSARLGRELSKREMEILSLHSRLMKNEEETRQLQGALLDREQELLVYANSNSWKITRPLRKIAGLVRKIIGHA